MDAFILDVYKILKEEIERKMHFKSLTFSEENKYDLKLKINKILNTLIQSYIVICVKESISELTNHFNSYYQLLPFPKFNEVVIF